MMGNPCALRKCGFSPRQRSRITRQRLHNKLKHSYAQGSRKNGRRPQVG
jgi:hypothetical protein